MRGDISACVTVPICGAVNGNGPLFTACGTGLPKPGAAAGGALFFGAAMLLVGTGTGEVDGGARPGMPASLAFLLGAEGSDRREPISLGNGAAVGAAVIIGCSASSFTAILMVWF